MSNVTEDAARAASADAADAPFFVRTSHAALIVALAQIKLREHDPDKAAMLLLLAARMLFVDSATFFASARMVDDLVARTAFTGADESKPS